MDFILLIQIFSSVYRDHLRYWTHFVVHIHPKAQISISHLLRVYPHYKVNRVVVVKKKGGGHAAIDVFIAPLLLCQRSMGQSETLAILTGQSLTRFIDSTLSLCFYH